MIKDRCKLIRGLIHCIHDVLEVFLSNPYSWTDKVNLIGLIEMHVHFLNDFLEVLKDEKIEIKSEKK